MGRGEQLGHAPVAGARIRGVVGHIRWAYYTAAAIEGYTVTRSKTGQWSLQATVALADAFKIAQRPLFFVAKHKYGEWQWPISSLDYDSRLGPNLRATLGNPLE